MYVYHVFRLLHWAGCLPCFVFQLLLLLDSFLGENTYVWFGHIVFWPSHEYSIAYGQVVSYRRVSHQ